MYEDDKLIVCIKPVGVLSQGDTSAEQSMETLLADHAKQIHCVHRLDRPVGGVMVYAKNSDTAAALSAQIAAGQLQKRYFAIVEGSPAQSGGVLHDFLFKDSRTRKVFAVARPRVGVKKAELAYRVLADTAEEHPLTLVLVQLHTGRMHQIRVQFASRKMPLAGDGKYGSRRKGGLALWSCGLTFFAPGTNTPLSFFAPPPREGFWCSFDSNLYTSAAQLADDTGLADKALSQSSGLQKQKSLGDI